MPKRSTGNSARGGRGRRPSQLARGYLEALRAADTAGAYRIATEALDGGMPLAGLYQEVVTPAMHELGRLWERGAITIADEHLATALTHRVLAALRPDPRERGDGQRPRAMLSTVEGEQHALGLRMAGDLLEDTGYEVIYLGADTPTAALLHAVDSLSPELLGLAATMPDRGPVLEQTVLEAHRANPRLRLLVGGQASGALRTREALRVEDLSSLPEKVRPLET
ncbi:MAG TPA: B12-binding domain-containing protein [Solirubrobacterales bacterium]